MTVQAADIYDMLKKIRYDATAIQAKVTDALNMLNELNIPDLPTAKCAKCGVEVRGPLKLAEHIYQMHDGPLPEHYARLDARALPPEEPVLEPEGEVAWETPVSADSGGAA